MKIALKAMLAFLHYRHHPEGMTTIQEFIAKTIQELQDARAMRGDRRSLGAAPHPGEDAGLRVCIDVPGLNRAASRLRVLDGVRVHLTAMFACHSACQA